MNNTTQRVQFNIPTELSLLIQDNINNIDNLVECKEFAFESDHRAYFHLIKTDSDSYFLFSKKTIKFIDGEATDVWSISKADADFLKKESKRMCYYTSTDKTKKLN